MSPRLSSCALRIIIVIVFAAGICCSGAQAQGILDRVVSLEANRQRLDNVLEILSNKGNFYFSYNSNIVRRDSLVSISVSNKTVRQVLGQLFDDSYEYMQSGNYI